jgi:hypothetical protein
VVRRACRLSRAQVQEVRPHPTVRERSVDGGSAPPAGAIDGPKGILASGPGSAEFRFAPTLCRRCNNQRSQPFDTAYDRFIEFALARRPGLVGSYRIDLAAVYGTAWAARADDLGRYFCKHIGCRLAAPANKVRVAIPGDLVAFMDGGDWPASLRRDIVLDRGRLGLARVFAAGGTPSAVLQTGDLGCLCDPSAGRALEAWSEFGNGWILVRWHTGASVAPSPFSDRVLRLRRVGSRVTLARLVAHSYRLRWAP